MTASQPLAVLPADRLDDLVALLVRRGFTVLAPTVRDEAITVEPITGARDLPRGVGERQDGGTYRLAVTDDRRVFRFVHGADSWKRWLYPPRQHLWRARRDGEGRIEFEPPELIPGPMAFFGVRSCDLAAIRTLDRVLLGVVEPDGVYAARRARLFLVAVDCADPGGTCFCASLATGPQAESGFDVRLTELDDGDGHRFLVATGSEAGADVITELDLPPAPAAAVEQRAAQGRQASARMGRHLEAAGLGPALKSRRESRHFDAVAERCLGCANCTMVCPTCFCTTVEDTTDLSGNVADRHRRWDSCFTLDFSYVVGGAVRASGSARYRQWLLHKLATWEDQFGGLGCVGCGRCITWCPVGIDLTVEATALRAEASP